MSNLRNSRVALSNLWVKCHYCLPVAGALRCGRRWWAVGCGLWVWAVGALPPPPPPSFNPFTSLPGLSRVKTHVFIGIWPIPNLVARARCLDPLVSRRNSPANA